MTKVKHKEIRATFTRRASQPQDLVCWYCEELEMTLCPRGPETFFEVPANQRALDLVVSTNPKDGWRLHRYSESLLDWEIRDAFKTTSFYHEVDNWICAFAKTVRGKPIYMSIEIDDDDVFKDSAEVKTYDQGLRVYVTLATGERTFFFIGTEALIGLEADLDIVNTFIERNRK